MGRQVRISKGGAPAATCRSDADAGGASLRLRMTSRRQVAAVLTPGGTGVEGETARFRVLRCCLRHPDGCAPGAPGQPCADKCHRIGQTRVALVGGSNANPLDDARDPRKTSIILAAYRAPTRSDAAAGPPAQRQTRKDAPFRRLPSQGRCPASRAAPAHAAPCTPVSSRPSVAMVGMTGEDGGRPIELLSQHNAGKRVRQRHRPQ